MAGGAVNRGVGPFPIVVPRLSAFAKCAPARFDDLFREHYPGLTRLATRVTGDPSAGEEIASDVFVQLLHARQPPPNPLAWLRRSTINAAIDRLRSEHRRRRREADVASVAHAALDPDLEQRRARVRHALSLLRRRDARLMVARLGGWTYREIAAALRVEETSVGSMLARAEKSFEKEYRKHYGDA